MLEPVNHQPEHSNLWKPKNARRHGSHGGRGGHGRRFNRQVSASEMPTNFSWVEKGMTTDVKIQETCSSCWTFSTNAVLETVYAIKNGGDKLDLSEQQYNCVYQRSVCGSGWPEGSLGYAKMHGVGYEADHPYNTTDEKCIEVKPQVKVSEFYSLMPFDMNELRQEIMNTGPIAFGMWLTEDFPLYAGGIYTEQCTEDKPKLGGHAMAIVGWGEELNPETNETVPYWIVKNSWGDFWGEDGYVRIQAGVDLCNMETRYLWSAEITEDKAEDRPEDDVPDAENQKLGEEADKEKEEAEKEDDEEDAKVEEDLNDVLSQL
ncbi:unnamed protein product, partial [Mesorhabditis spiculigera]